MNLEQIVSELRQNGYEPRRRGTGWTVREPLGGTATLASDEQLLEYALGRVTTSLTNQSSFQDEEVRSDSNSKIYVSSGYARKLGGWPRLCIVLGVLYAFPIILVISWNWPDAPGAKTEWAENSVALMVQYAGIGRRVERYELFGPATDDEVISYIYGQAFPGADLARSPGTVRDSLSLAQLQDSCFGEYKRELAARTPEKNAVRENEGSGGAPVDNSQKFMEEVDKLFEKQREAEATERCRVEALKSVLQPGKFTEVKDFNLPAFKVGLTNLTRAYYEQLDEVSHNKRDMVARGFLVWLVPVIAVYLLGLAVAWVYRGFKEPRA